MRRRTFVGYLLTSAVASLPDNRAEPEHEFPYQYTFAFDNAVKPGHRFRLLADGKVLSQFTQDADGPMFRYLDIFSDRSLGLSYQGDYIAIITTFVREMRIDQDRPITLVCSRRGELA